MNKYNKLVSNFYKIAFRSYTNNLIISGVHSFGNVPKTNHLLNRKLSNLFDTNRSIYYNVSSFYATDTVKESDNKIPNMYVNFTDITEYYILKMLSIFDDIAANYEIVNESKTKERLYKICPELLDDPVFDYLFHKIFIMANDIWLHIPLKTQ